MTNLKKTMWSKMFSVIVGFALVFSVLFGSVALNNANAYTEGQPYNAGTFIGDLYEFTTGFSENNGNIEDNEYIDQSTGKFKTDILLDDSKVLNLESAHKYYPDLSEKDKSNSMVEAGKKVLDKIWAEVFETPRSLISEMDTKLTPILEQGVKYSDYKVVDALKEKLDTTLNLDVNQKHYVMYKLNNNETDNVPTIREEYQKYLNVVDALEELTKTLNKLVEDINGLSSKIGNIEYSDKALIVDIENRYNALEESAKEYVNSKATEENIATVRAELDAIIKKIASEVDVELQEMIDREIVYSDKARINEIQADYDMLDEDDKETVKDATNLTEAHKAIKDYVESVVSDIDNTLGDILTAKVKYSDKKVIKDIDAKYSILDSEDKEYVQNAEKDNTGCQNFENLANAKNALQAIIDEIARQIDEDLQEAIDAPINYKDHRDLVYNIVNAYNSLDEEDQEKVATEICKDFANLEEATNWFEIYFNNLKSYIDNELEEMIKKPIVYSDKTRIYEIDALYQILVEDDKQMMQDDYFEDFANLQEAKDALKKILTDLVSAIDNELEEMIKKPIVYSDKTRIYEIRDAFNALDDTDKAFVKNEDKTNAEGCQDFANLQEALDALDKLFETLAKRIDEDLENITLDNFVYTDKASTIKNISKEYNDLSDENKTKIQEKCQDFANLGEAEKVLSDYLDGIVKAVDEDLETLINKPIEYSDKKTIKDIEKSVEELDAEDRAIVDAKFTDFDNIAEAKAALKAIINAVVDMIDEDLEILINKPIVYSDKEAIYNVKNAYEALDAEDQSYVRNEGNSEFGCQDFANLQEALDALNKILNDIAKAIDENLDGITDENFDYSEKAQLIKDINKNYNDLDETDASIVKDVLCNKFENLENANTVLDNYINSLVKAVDEELEELIKKPIVYTDKSTINDILNAIDELDAEDTAKLNERLTDAGNIEEAKAALKAILDANADKIDKDLEDLLEKGIELSDEETINNINNEYKSFDEEDKAYVRNEDGTENGCQDFANLQEALDALEALKNKINQVIDEIDNELEDMLEEGIDYSDKERIEEIKKNFDDLSNESQTYVKNEEKDLTGCQDFENLQEALDALKELEEKMGDIIDYIKSLDEILTNGVLYSYKTQFEAIVAKYDALDESAKAYINANTNYQADKATVSAALTEIETRATNAKNVISSILYYLEGSMKTDATGEVVYSSYETYLNAVSALAAIYNGTSNIANLAYPWNDTEVTALSVIITNLDNFNAVDAKFVEFKALANSVSEKITAITVDDTNNYKALETTINSVYAEYVALNFEGYNDLHNLQNFVEASLKTKIADLKAKLDAANEWILKVAKLVDSTATSETADKIIANAILNGLDDLVTIVLADVQSVKADYSTLVGENGITAEVDSIMVASVADAYTVLGLIEARIEKLNEDLINDITDIVNRDPEFKEGDFEKSEEIKEIYRELDDSQKDKLEDGLNNNDTSYEEFLKVVEKLLFAEYFRLAVEELYAEVNNGYFTVEGYVLENTLLSLYNTLSVSYQNLIGTECITNLLKVNELYREKKTEGALLDYNKLQEQIDKLGEVCATKEELEEKYQELLGMINSLRTEVLGDVTNKLNTMSTTITDLQTKLAAVETSLDAEIQNEIAGLKNILENQIKALKTQLENSVKELKDTDASLQEQIDSLKKMVIIGGSVLAGVSLVLLICVMVLFGKVKNAKSNESKEDDEDEPEEESDEDED